MHMNCKYCDAPLAKNEKICHRCGRYFAEEEKEIKSDHRRRNIWIGLGVTAIAVIFILTTFGGSLMQQKAANEHLEQQVARTSANNLGITMEKFKDVFNHNPYTKKSGLAIGDIALIKGENENTFQYALTSQLILTGVVGKLDHKLMELSIIEQPTNDHNDQLKWVTAMGVVIDTFSPDMPEAQRKEILKELGFYQDKDLSKANAKAVRGDVTYYFKFVDRVGYVFTVANTNYRP